MPLFLQPFARYAIFTGRARRAEYWGYGIAQAVILALIATLALTGGSLQSGLFILLIGGGLFALACFLPTLAVTVRRLHDTGRSALWLLLYAPGVVSALLVVNETIANHGVMPAYPLFSGLGGIANLAMLILLGLPGTKGPNRFGADPKGGDEGRIARIFDAPNEESDDDVLAPKPYTPVFDFSPAGQAQPRMAPEPPVMPTTRPATRPVPQGFSAPARPVFGKRGRLS
jgi:uncharacterized membrane protein YhaH (DUF805 family)